ncbi:DEAD/DEAH box helicase [Tistrella mobilis]|uniref:Superfamily I DNA/RNA helicase n=1 Tax=Tistrella mobilis (strain KA081020-065) TaxID=1110502 RepID=I3TMM4_TISMK|nr:ATP-binding protein [Tistrella mobilis]AFK54012.1 superfamily I DNA/RNA helicase [Tistrella mobilis KA081020-065]
MVSAKRPKRSRSSLEERFVFVGDAVAAGDREALRSAMFEVEDRITGLERTLKLWRKTGTAVDDDLRQLWHHEMRQVQRVMAYAGARDVIVDVLEFVEDDENFGVVLERVGQPLVERRRRAPRPHWLRNLGAPRPRTLFWRNLKRVVTALGIVHAQGLVHGRLTADAIMTEGADEPDFQLGGFEWSLWLSADVAEHSHARVTPATAVNRAESYSFAEDWRALGLLAAECLDSEVRASGDIVPRAGLEVPIMLQVPERVLLKRLVAPGRMDHLEAGSIGRAIDDLIVTVGRSATARAGAFVLTFDAAARLGEAIYDASQGEIAGDEYRRQLDWVQADLDAGATLLVPQAFDPGRSQLRLVTDNMVYRLRAFRDGGVALWDIAVAQGAEVRGSRFSLGDAEEHALTQGVIVTANAREAQETRGRLGPDALDWSGFAAQAREVEVPSETAAIRRALMLVQVVEAVVKALEVYPIEVLESGRAGGRRFVVLRAEPNNERDGVAKKVGLLESANALRRLFEEEHQDAEAKWRISQASSLGATRAGDVVASFVDVVEHRGRRAYRFEIDEELPDGDRFFLRTERDTGTEQVIGRRLRNIKALDTRVDLAEMLADPWRVRRSSRETLSEEDRKDPAFLDLDVPKQEALAGLWATLPAYFVVGPPGVGKTKLATEVVRRRFVADRSTRMLVSAQGHDALDNLQQKIKESLAEAALTDVLVVRSTTNDQRPTSDEEVHRAGLDYLERLSRSTLAADAPSPIRARVTALKEAAGRLETAKETVDRDHRAGLGAVSHLVLDAANIVISTANSPDVERLVEAREQFDWVLIEEAAKAIGPELVGPLMLSGRRLLIGDHHQLPPFEADRLVKILSDHSLVERALSIAEQMIGPLLRDGELDELEEIRGDADTLRETSSAALRLLEPFRTVVDDDERRALTNPAHRPVAATLTEQRRMDPAIAEIVSKAFYNRRLTTEEKRAKAAEREPPPMVHHGALPASPVVVVDFPHVSATGRVEAFEQARPRWHNPREVDAVVDVLRLLRARDPEDPPSLAILSPYKAQVEKLHHRVASARGRELKHLDEFRAVRSNGAFVGTVDSFQGSEADVVVLSLVRNNAMTGGRALGFLRDRRRMNVALSRAKSQLIIVGSLAFMREAVRGVNPDAESHDLSFLTEMVDAIEDLARRKRGDLPLASLVAPAELRARR